MPYEVPTHNYPSNFIYNINFGMVRFIAFNF